MKKHLIFLFLIMSAIGLSQSPDDSTRDAMQEAFNHSLKGLPAVTVVRFTGGPDLVKKFTLGKVSEDQLDSQIETILKRFRIPLVSTRPGPFYENRDDVGALFVTTTARGVPGEASASVTLKIELQEAAYRKRDPLQKVVTISWFSDELEIVVPATNDAGSRFSETISQLAQQFALAYLTANKD
jgi:hypothetical protein